MNTLDQIRKFIRARHLFSKGDKVIVGVSGGPDSVALIYSLNQLQFELGLRLTMAHFNHHLRKSATGDQQFVEGLSKKLNIPLIVGHWRSPKTKNRQSSEEQSREKRFRFLIDLAKKNKAHCVALGHHQDDLAETVLMRIIRGTGLQGLRAILPKKMIQGLTIVRPLLAIDRAQIEHYLTQGRIKFKIDPTNRKKHYLRNQIRLDLIPYLEKKYNKNIRSILGNLSQLVTIDYDYLKNQADKYFLKMATISSRKGVVKLPRAKFESLHLSMKRMVLRRAFKRLIGSTNRLTARHFEEIEQLLRSRSVDSIIHLPFSVNIYNTGNYIILSTKP